MTKPRVMQCLGDMINNSGAENYTDAKRVELALNDMLTNGWTGITGRAYDANADYLAAKDAIDGGVKADSWEKYLEDHQLSLIDGLTTEEELRAEWEAQHPEAGDTTETEPGGQLNRLFVDYEDKATRDRAFADKAQELADKGKTIEITANDVQAQASGTNWGNLQAVRKYIRDSLKSIFGTDSVYFTDNGATVEAHLTREGIKHSATTVKNEAGAAAILKARELVDKAEYVFSSDHDIHSQAGQNIDSGTIWDYYEAVVTFGNETIPVRFTLRNVIDDPRAQINKIGVLMG